MIISSFYSLNAPLILTLCPAKGFYIATRILSLNQPMRKDLIINNIVTAHHHFYYLMVAGLCAVSFLIRLRHVLQVGHVKLGLVNQVYIVGDN